MSRRLPEDIMREIYSCYYKLHVLPRIALHPMLVRKESPLLLWQSSLHAALSRANMYIRGALDISKISPSDRVAIYSELERRPNIRTQIQVNAGKLVLLADAHTLPHRYYEPAFACIAGIQLDGDEYLVTYNNHW